MNSCISIYLLMFFFYLLLHIDSLLLNINVHVISIPGVYKREQDYTMMNPWTDALMA